VPPGPKFIVSKIIYADCDEGGHVMEQKDTYGIHISRTNYASQMLEKYNMQESREIKTPMATTPPTND
jgi:hypothetical protein